VFVKNLNKKKRIISSISLVTTKNIDDFQRESHMHYHKAILALSVKDKGKATCSMLVVTVKMEESNLAVVKLSIENLEVHNNILEHFWPP